jgi:hypothetical protein
MTLLGLLGIVLATLSFLGAVDPSGFDAEDGGAPYTVGQHAVWGAAAGAAGLVVAWLVPKASGMGSSVWLLGAFAGAAGSVVAGHPRFLTAQAVHIVAAVLVTWVARTRWQALDASAAILIEGERRRLADAIAEAQSSGITLCPTCEHDVTNGGRCLCACHRA